MDTHLDNTTKAGTACGTVLTILVNITRADILQTGVLAAVGAIVSFCVTLLLKYLAKRWKR